MLNNSLNLQWIPGTSNIVERLFGRAKLTLDDKKIESYFARSVKTVV